MTKREKQPNSLSALISDKYGISFQLIGNKIWHIHTMEYYLVIKGSKILIHAATWMNFENIMPSRGSQLQRCHLFEINE